MSRILCLIESLGSGGAERQLVGLASLLKRRGHDVTVLTYYPDDFYKHVLDKAHVNYEYYSKAQNKKRRILVLRKKIKEMKLDSVISYMDTESMVACIIKMLGVKYNLIVSERNTSQTNSIKERIKFFLYRWANWIVPNSYMQETFIKVNYPNLSEKVRTITNFVDTDFFKPAENSISKDIRMLCVGRLTAQKNVLTFLKALSILHNDGVSLTIDWVGNMRTQYANDCFALIDELGLQNCIIFKGETKDVLSEYHNHDVLCLPSLYEGFPNVVCEAMSCGLPVLCSDVCDNPRIIKEGENGFLFDPKSEQSISDTIKRFILLPTEKRKEIGEANRKLAIKLFSAERFIMNYEELI